jgi:predicted restriction endonuclease
MSYTKRDYDDPVYKAWRVAVFKRDGFKCQFPGCKCKTKLNAHHIIRWADAPFLRFEPTNGITLCKVHHKMIEGAENCYAELFSSIVHAKLKGK